jgi:hypothetical protein
MTFEEAMDRADEERRGHEARLKHGPTAINADGSAYSWKCLHPGCNAGHEVRAADYPLQHTEAAAEPPRDISPAWTGASGPEIRAWARAPGRVAFGDRGMGYELLYTPQNGRKYEALPFGARLERIRSQRSFDLVPLTVCVGEHHVTPHVGCILR